MTAPSGQANVVLLREVGPITFLGPKSIEITPKTYENPFQLPNLPNLLNLLNLLATSSFFSRFSSYADLVPNKGKSKRSMSWGSILYSIHMQGLILRGCPSYIVYYAAPY
ncbi:hypothetical protein ACN38_g7958 [Penicillium nordicum]|uniref:Uncharacterized protein n=1 Tax=Penicillium nordicum TaxID=229535 RepID=A0A0M9WE51_9EURO|nr:hypothetical protein ACN38_g7958 [Penicillium nordicum]